MEKFACVIFAIVIGNFVFVDVWSKSLPSYISPHVCSRSDPKLTTCLMDLVERLRPMFAKGMPEINVPALEPFHMPEITVTLDPKNVGLNATTSVKVVLRDARCFGVSDFKVNKLKLDLEQFTYILGVEFPSLVCKGDYNVDARILNIPIKGNGPVWGNGTFAKGTAIIKAKLVEKDDGNHIHFENINLKMDVDEVTIQVGNNYQGETFISEAFNALLKDNSKLYVQAFMPVLEKTVSKIFLQMGNAVADAIVYDEFLSAK